MPGGEFRGWHSRGYLPHFDGNGVIQAVTFRLADALPGEVVERWKVELAGSAGLQTGSSFLLQDVRSGDHRSQHQQNRAKQLRERIARYEDAGYGACVLRDPVCAGIVQSALLFFDGERYRMFDWCVMPNHVHVMIQTSQEHSLEDIVKSWKGFTARRINQYLGRSGPLWAREYHDRYIRDAAHFDNARCYIRQNPVKAKLCTVAEAWPWSSAGTGTV